MIFDQAAKLIGNADALLICAGAGMGVDSGLPDFRGNQGFWNAYPPYAEKGLSFIDMANPNWFSNDPEFAWGFYGHRLGLYRETKPHEGFDILLKWAKQMSFGYFVFTSNVDGHFQKAGFPEDRIMEVHGSIHYMQCLNNCDQETFDGFSINVQVDETTMNAIAPLPTCPKCSSLLRPNILMFGDYGWNGSRQERQSGDYSMWLREIEGMNLVIIECGAGTGVPTVRYETEKLANRIATAIRINVREPQISPPNLSINEGAADSLRKIDEILGSITG